MRIRFALFVTISTPMECVVLSAKLLSRLRGNKLKNV